MWSDNLFNSKKKNFLSKFFELIDPLNLNSMQDEEINRAMNAVTPKSSPLPIPKHRKEAIDHQVLYIFFEKIEKVC